jgi:hypothetical protein
MLFCVMQLIMVLALVENPHPQVHVGQILVAQHLLWCLHQALADIPQVEHLVRLWVSGFDL